MNTLAFSAIRSSRKTPQKSIDPEFSTLEPYVGKYRCKDQCHLLYIRCVSHKHPRFKAEATRRSKLMKAVLQVFHSTWQVLTLGILS